MWANTEITSRLPSPLLLLKERSCPRTVTVSPTDSGTIPSCGAEMITASLSARPLSRSTDSVNL